MIDDDDFAMNLNKDVNSNNYLNCLIQIRLTFLISTFSRFGNTRKMSLQSPFKAGEVKIPEDSDFMSFKNMCNQNDDWKQEVNKNQTAVWTKANDLSNFKMVKVSNYKNVTSRRFVCVCLFNTT